MVGPDHPDTLAIRGNLADWQGRAGNLSDALGAYEELYEDYVRVLGPEHPHTFLTRGAFANWLGLAGGATAAVATFGAVLEDMLKVLDPPHPDIRLTRIAWPIGTPSPPRTARIEAPRPFPLERAVKSL